MTKFVSVAALLLALFCLAAAPSRFERFGHNLMCTCGCNQVLLECNHVGCPNSAGMRTKLASFVQDGKTDDAIYKEFIADYGNVVVAAPLGGGFNRVAWIAPFAVLFAGVIGIGVVAKRWQSQHASAPVATSMAEHLSEFAEQARRETEL